MFAKFTTICVAAATACALLSTLPSNAQETISREEAASEFDALPFPAQWTADTRTEMWAPDGRIEMRGTYKRKGDMSSALTLMNLGGLTTSMKVVQDANQIRWTEFSAGPGQTEVFRQDLDRIYVSTGEPVGSAISGNENPAAIWRPMFEYVDLQDLIEVTNVEGDERLTFSIPSTDEVIKKISAQTALRGMEFDRMRITVGRNDGILREIRMQALDGSTGTSTQYHDVQVGVEIPDSEFMYTPPVGAPVLDITLQSIQEMRGAAPQGQQH